MGLRTEQESLDLIARQGTGIHAEELTVAAAGTAEQFAAFTVNRPFLVTFRAASGNTNPAFIAGSKTNAETAASRFQLAPGASVQLQLSNLDQAWCDVTTSGEKVHAVVETSTTLGG